VQKGWAVPWLFFNGRHEAASRLAAIPGNEARAPHLHCHVDLLRGAAEPDCGPGPPAGSLARKVESGFSHSVVMAVFISPDLLIIRNVHLKWSEPYLLLEVVKIQS
jgi:hypothetical protein